MIVLFLLAMGFGMAAWAEEAANNNYVWAEAPDETSIATPAGESQGSGFTVTPAA